MHVAFLVLAASCKQSVLYLQMGHNWWQVWGPGCWYMMQVMASSCMP